VALSAGTRIGPFVVMSPLGKGGMGEVYRARDTKLGREVALKILPEPFSADAQRLSRFKREAEVLAALNHSNIGAIYGFEEDRALVLELVDGPTLADHLVRGALPIEEATSIARQIAAALSAAHELGIVHRDLKPSNIKLRADGTVKVLDFGLARVFSPNERDGDPSLSTITQTGVVIGTAAYMSPEQARGLTVDKRTDIWAFGCVLYEMLTGRCAFDGGTLADTLALVVSRDPDWSLLPGNLPRSISALVRQCLEREPRERIGDMAVAAFVLKDPRPASGVDVSRDSSMRLVTGTRSSWVRLAAVSGLALVIGAALTLAAMRLTSRRPPGVTRTTIATYLPAQFSLDAADRSVALTPDGTRIVYLGNDKTQIFVRALDSLEPIPIVTAASLLRGLFISPDGQWVGYFESNTTLKKVAITGGPSVTIHAGDSPSRGAVWMRDHTIVFGTGSTDTGLLRVSADGGPVTVLTRPKPALGEFDHVHPSSLPDGRRMLFTISAPGGASPRVALFDPETGEWKRILEGSADAIYLPSGHLLHAVGETLRAVAFDLTALETRGAAVTVVPHLVSSGPTDFAVAENGTLIYVDGRGPIAPPRSLVFVDRRGRETPLTSPAETVQHPRISPDGARVIYNTAGDLLLWDVARSRQTRLTFAPQQDWSPVWMPDGKRMVFGSWRGGGLANLYMQTLDGGSDAERLLDSPEMHHPTGVTPDGSAVVFHDVRGSVQLLPLAPPRTPITLVETPLEERNAVVSPDGRWLAYEGEGEGRPGQIEIWVRRFPKGAGQWQVSSSGGVHAVWARSGRELFYRATDGSLMAVPVEAVADRWSSGAPLKLFNGPYLLRTNDLVRHYDVSPDGQRFVMVKLQAPDPAEVAPHIVVVQNWVEELNRLVPVD
jgi:Tol biopolymer transport system component/predicted Ser/Thr protein kinase